MGADELLLAAQERLAGPRSAVGWQEPSQDVVTSLSEAASPLVLAGPGVVRDGAIAGLHAFAVAGDLGVLNTWGAKGIFNWQSRHHLATVGLQARDAELAGVPGCDLLVLVGVDPLESPPAQWHLAPVLEVPTAMLAPLAETWSRPRRGFPMPPLRDRLAAATQAGWAVTGAPLAPSQVTRNYGAVVSAGGVVAADPGLAGFWVARTLGTTRPGAVHVPAEADADGFAVACAAVAGRGSLAVVDSLGDAALELLDRFPSVAVEVWSPDGEVLDADAHAARLARLVGEGGVARLAPATDQLAAFEEAAGPITAWAGLLA
jgi:hypothetical protein